MEKWSVWLINFGIASCVYQGFSKDNAFDTYTTLGNCRKFSAGIFCNEKMVSYNGRKDE